VTEIDLVVDAGWFFNPKPQTVLVRNVQVNDQTFFAPQQAGGGGGKAQSPAQLCEAELKSIGKTAFEHRYGNNHNLRNAMGSASPGSPIRSTTSSTTSDTAVDWAGPETPGPPMAAARRGSDARNPRLRLPALEARRSSSAGTGEGERCKGVTAPARSRLVADLVRDWLGSYGLGAFCCFSRASVSWFVRGASCGLTT
jgi:hypothetical protein